MKKLLTIIIISLFAITSYSQNTGDVAVIGVNYDDPDDILFVTFVDIPATEDIYFTDYSWNGSSWVSSGACGWLKYTPPAGGLSAGEVVQIRIGSTITATTGTAVSDGGLLRLINSSGKGDKLYVYLGSDKDNPTTFLFAHNTRGSWGANELTNTGLTEGVNALVFSDGKDNSKYNGPTTGTASYLKSEISDIDNNWSTQNSRYTFSTTPFNILGETNRPTSLSINYITATKINITWSKPTGEYGTDWNGVVVFACQSNPNDGSVSSTDGSSYTGDLNFGSGTPFGSGFTVANQTSDSDGDITVVGLTEGQEYYFIAYTYKTESGTNNDTWSEASIEVNDQAEVQGVSNLAAYPSTELVDLSWTNYSGTVNTWWDEVMIVAKAGTEVDATPTGDGSAYNAASVFGSGTELGTGNFVVYKGTGSLETVTNLTNETAYHFRAFVRYGSYWTDADQYQSISSTPVITIEEPSTAELIINEVNDVLWSDAGYFELYNNTTSAIKLDEVSVEYYILGQSTPHSTINFSHGIISAGDYFTIAQGLGFDDKYGKSADAYFSYGTLFSNSTKDGIALRTSNNGIIDRFNDVPAATVSRIENHLYERTAYPNDGSDLNLHWSDVGYDQYGTPGTANNSPLPVELTTFTASNAGNVVKLNWETATEVNNYGFNIERKPEDGNWNKIGFVEGNGNSNSPKKYIFTDNNVNGGKYLYRLKQIDINGSSEYSKELEVVINNVPKKFKLAQNYPNPFNPATIIEYSIPEVKTLQGKYQQVQLKVYNILGKEVATLVNARQQAGNYKVSFDGKSLSSGVYYYKISAGSFTKIKRMILIK